MWAKRCAYVVDSREYKQFLIGIALLGEPGKRRTSGVKALAQLSFDLLASRVFVHQLGTIANGRSDILDIAILPPSVGAPMKIPASLLESGHQGYVGA